MTSCPAEYDIFDETSGRIWYDKVRLRQDRFPECAIAAGEIRMHRNGSCRAASVCGGTGKSLLRKSDEALDSNWGIAVYYDYDYVSAPIYLWPFTPNIIATGGFVNGYGFSNK